MAVSGETAIVGAIFNAGGGSAYVFARDEAGNWAEEAKLRGIDTEGGDGFGGSVAASGDTVLVGAYLDDDGGSSSGSAYVFVRDGGGN